MNFSRLSRYLCLPLAVLLFSQTVHVSGNFSSGKYMTSPVVVVVAFDERDDDKPFDIDLPAVVSKGALIQRYEKVSWDLDFIPQGAILVLHATGPPSI